MVFQQAQAAPTGYLMAQNNSGSTDPFADFSEFSEDAEEEADINFFKNGRFFNAGIMIGTQVYTEAMAEVFSSSTPFGIYITYFFDLRFALQFTYLSSQGTASAVSNLENTFSNSSELTMFGIDIKYYFNTQNVTRGLADLNPYLIVGFAQVVRTISSDASLNIGQDSTNGFEIGAGIEFPMLQNKMYIGFQGMFHLINFANETQELEIDNDPTGIFPGGDVISALAIVGVNF